MWISFVGVTLLGYTEKEVGHFTFSKWNQLYEHFKRYYNFKQKGEIFQIEPSEDEINESYEWFTD